MIHLDKERTAIAKSQAKSQVDPGAKQREGNKPKGGATASKRRDESGVVAKPLKMTKVSPNKHSYTSNQNIEKIHQRIRKIKKILNTDAASNTGGGPRKAGRPRSLSIAAEKGKHRSSAMSSNKGTTSADYQHHNGKMAQEELIEKFKGNYFDRATLLLLAFWTFPFL